MTARLLVSLSGSGHLLCYQLGAVRALLQAPTWGERVVGFAGTSGGAIVAAGAALLADEPCASHDAAWDAFLEASCRGGAFAHVAQLGRELGPGSPTRVDGAPRPLRPLFIGATECETGRPATFAQYGTAEELLACVLASAAIPRSAHPTDLLFARSRPLRYPSREGVFVPRSCEWRAAQPGSSGGEGSEEAARAEASGEWQADETGAYVDGGLSSALPLLPAPALARLRVTAVVTVSPFAGPRGLSPRCGPLRLLQGERAPGGHAAQAEEASSAAGCTRARDARPAHQPALPYLLRYHLCPESEAPAWAQLPLPPADLGGGLRCAWSLGNARAALLAALGGPAGELRGWYERGRADALRALVSRGGAEHLLGLGRDTCGDETTAPIN